MTESNASSSPELIRRERDFYINYLKIVAYNGAEYTITPQMIDFTYHENIATPCIYASVTLYDTIDFPTLLPMIGEERLKVSFTRQDESAVNGEGALKDPIILDMPIYKISNRSPENVNRKGQLYTIHATSDEMLQSLKSKVRLGLKDMPYSAMVERVYNDYIKVTKPVEIESTQHNYDFCIANMPPLRFISHVSGKSISPEFGGCLYFFYEDRQKFNYKSLGTLFKEEPSLTFGFGVKNVLKSGGERDTGPKERNFEVDLYTIENMEHKSSFDLIRTILSGGYSQKTVFFDPVRQMITEKEFDIDEEWDSLPHIDKVKPFTDANKAKKSPDSKIVVQWTNAEHDTVEHIVAKEPGIKPFRYEDYTMRVSSQLELMLRNAIDAVLPGTPDLKAGMTINFELPEHLGKVSDADPEEKDAYLQGKYLVVSVMHKITTTEYTCSTTLAKDAFFSDINHRDPEDEYPINRIF